MTRIFLAAGVAALAISAPAASKPGGNGGGHGHATAQERGGHGGQAKAEARGGGQAQARMQARVQARNDRASARLAARGEARVKARAEARQADRQQARRFERIREARQDRVRQVQQRQAERIREARNDRIRDIREARADRVRDMRAAQAERIRDIRDNRREALRDFNRREALRDFRNDRDFNDRVAGGYGAGGCPPGLASKGCMPPGQAKALVGQRLNSLRERVAFRDLPQRLRSVYRDTPDYYYRYGDGGYVYRVNRTNEVVSALLPLFGLGYTAGQTWPVGYNAYNYGLPTAYQPFYPQTPYADYRYANGYVYEVDPYTGLIRDVDPMLGYGYGYGQMMPAAYSAYNVPYQYRPYYYDTSDYYYRYAPGAIYQVDPTTSLITGVAALLSPNSLAIGQQLPMGYSAYNVPYDYRARYYDTPNDWYRYSNGNIYRVDPMTQLVTALVASILT